jgi:hypothetical protein
VQSESQASEKGENMDKELNPEVRVRIEAVSRAWNEMLQRAIASDTKTPLVFKTEFGDITVTFTGNPIVSMLQPNGEMIPLSDALSKLFELTWE